MSAGVHYARVAPRERGWSAAGFVGRIVVALVFLRSSAKFTFPVGLQSFFQQNSTNWGLVMAVAVVMMLPPVILFATLNRYFSVGGIGGSLAGQ